MQEDPNKITYFATTNSRGEEKPFGIKKKDRGKHMYIIGKTGMGKSTLLENLAIQDIRNGEAVAFIDPHGQTAERLLEYIPEHRKRDVVYFAPFDMEHPIGFNVMEDVGYDKRHLVVSGLITAFKKIWVDAFSARMEYILSNTLLALLEYPGATMLDVNRMLVNKHYRKKVVDNIKDPIVKDFWNGEFASYSDRYTQEATPAIQNKVGQFTSNPLIRNIVGQAKSSFDIREMMDQKKILIINLSKGRVGEVNAQLLGSMLVTKIYLAAMSRADISASVLATLPQFYFYVDEFQNFANESFADILSEARKYKLNLIIAHQYIEQMDEEVRDAVFGNVGTTISFRVGPFDAEVLETIFQPVFMATDLVNLGFAQIYLTLMIDGVGSPPFSAATLPPFDPPPQSFVDEVIVNSRTQFGAARAEVERVIQQIQDDNPLVAEASKTKSRRLEGVGIPTQASEKTAPTAHPVHTSVSHMPKPLIERADEIKNEVARIIPEYQKAAPSSRAPNKPIQSQAAARSGISVSLPPKPPLEGSQSLKEALAQALGKKPQNDKPRPQSGINVPLHTPDLKATLHAVAPKAEAKAPAAAKLPEDELRSMLAVDEGLDNEKP
ncbi:MAG: type IV secretion system DNA-binding domain-containing protein [Minisyncoccia bacterium]|jgi:energy-coupling factor transporter ATP-binding protein EcfA2